MSKFRGVATGESAGMRGDGWEGEKTMPPLNYFGIVSLTAALRHSIKTFLESETEFYCHLAQVSQIQRFNLFQPKSLVLAKISPVEKSKNHSESET